MNKEQQKEYYKANKDKILEQQKEYREANKEQKKEYYKANKEQIREYQKEYREANKEQKKEYYKANKEQILEQQKEYYKANKDKILEQIKEYQKVRRKIDPNYKIRSYISKVINQALKRNSSSKKGKSCMKYLPYTTIELKNHLEKQFEPWMTWNNHGVYNCNTWNDNDQSTWTWQIDHIIPQSQLPYTSMEDENFLKCWSLDNLRPLSAKQNIIDGNRR